MYSKVWKYFSRGVYLWYYTKTRVDIFLPLGFASWHKYITPRFSVIPIHTRGCSGPLKRQVRLYIGMFKLTIEQQNPTPLVHQCLTLTTWDKARMAMFDIRAVEPRYRHYQWLPRKRLRVYCHRPILFNLEYHHIGPTELGGGGAVGADAHTHSSRGVPPCKKNVPNSFTKVTTCVQPHNQTDHPGWRSKTVRRTVNSMRLSKIKQRITGHD